MKELIEKFTSEINDSTLASLDQVEEFRIKWLSKKGLISCLFEDFKSVGPEEKKEYGKPLNVLKQFAESKWREAKEEL